MRYLKNIGLILACLLGLGMFFIGMSVGSLMGFGHFLVHLIGRPELGFSSHLFGFAALAGGMIVAGLGLGLIFGGLAWASNVLRHGLFSGFLGAAAVFMLYAYFTTYETSTIEGKGILLIFSAICGLMTLLMVILTVEEARKERERVEALQWDSFSPTQRAKRVWGMK